MSGRRENAAAVAALLASALVALAATAASEDPLRQTVSEEPVRMVIELDKSTARVAEPVTLSVRVEAPRSAEVQMPVLQSPLGRLEVGAQQRWDALPSEAAGGEPVRRWIRRARLESIRAGQFELPPLEVRYRLEESSPWRSLRSEPVPIRIHSVVSESADPRDFRDLKPPVAVEPAEPASARWREAIFGSIAALLIGIAIVTYRMARRHRSDPAATARRRLDQLAELDGSAASAGSIYLELEQIMRDFLADRFDFAAHSRSTEELMQWIEAAGVLSSAERGKLEAILRRADRIKYARQAASREESERAIAETREVIDRISAGSPAAETPAREVA